MGRLRINLVNIASVSGVSVSVYLPRMPLDPDLTFQLQSIPYGSIAFTTQPSLSPATREQKKAYTQQPASHSPHIHIHTTTTTHLFPFFFFPFPPPCACCPSCFCTTTSVATPLPSTSPTSPITSSCCPTAVSTEETATPAIRLPSCPSICTSRPTSAALEVLYLRVTPLAGSKVLRTRWPRGGFASSFFVDDAAGGAAGCWSSEEDFFGLGVRRAGLRW